MTTWQLICSVEDIPPLGSRVVRRERGADVAIFRSGEDEIFALLDRCPHKGGVLSQGIVFGKRVACPLHNWNIQLDCGEAVAPDFGCTPSFAVRIDKGEIYLDAQELATVGIDTHKPAWSALVRKAT